MCVRPPQQPPPPPLTCERAAMAPPPPPLPAAPPPLTVPGLRNVGNSCFMAAALQALASSRLLCAHVAELAAAFEEAAAAEQQQQQQPQRALAARAMRCLLAAARAGWRLLLHGVDDAEADEAAMAARAARGRLTLQLAALLAALQPRAAAARGQGPEALSPAALMSELAWFLPDGVLQPGAQHDAAEALEALCNAVATEAACLWRPTARSSSCSHHGRPRPAGLLELLPAPVTGGARAAQVQDAQRCRRCPQPDPARQPAAPLVSASTCASPPVEPGEHQLLAAQPFGLGGAAPAGSCAGPLQQRRKQGNNARGPAVCRPLPLVGHSVSLLTCLACGYRSYPRSLVPFMCLALPLPARRAPGQDGLVVRGCDLAGCLSAYSAPEVVEGVECLRCSLRASLAAAPAPPVAAGPGAGAGHRSGTPAAPDGLARCSGAAPGGASPRATPRLLDGQQRRQQQQQPEQLSELLSRLRRLSALGGEGPPALQYQEQLEQAGLPWVPVRTRVLKRQCLARAPPVLLLQLQRSAYLHRGAGGTKVEGHVSFPLLLELRPHLLYEEAPPPPLDDEQQQQQEQQLQAAAPSPLLCTGSLYELVAVVQHAGAQSSGHYLMFRQASPPGGGSGGGGSGGGGSGPRGSPWLRVNDSRVAVVSEADVLACDATLLLYERCGGRGE